MFKNFLVQHNRYSTPRGCVEDYNDVAQVENYDARTTHNGRTSPNRQRSKLTYRSHKIINQTIITTLLHKKASET